MVRRERSSAGADRAENPAELFAERLTRSFHSSRYSQGVQAGDAVFAYAARNDAGEMLQVWRNVQRDAVPSYPSGDADADRGDFAFRTRAGILYPHADAAHTPAARYAEYGQGLDEHGFQRRDVGMGVARRHVTVRAEQVEHDVGYELAWSMIGPLPATPGSKRLEPVGLGEIGRFGRGASGVERRMFQQPNLFAGLARTDLGDPVAHRLDGDWVGHWVESDQPLGTC